MVFRLFRQSANRQVIDRLSGEIVAAARNPVLFAEYGIEDSLEGRFEAVTLHAVLVLRRLNGMDLPAPDIAQDLTDAIFRSFECALREMGVGDLAVPKQMKTIAGAFYGRATAYDQALRGCKSGLKAALARNVYDGRKSPERLARLCGSGQRSPGQGLARCFHSRPGSVSGARRHLLSKVPGFSL